MTTPDMSEWSDAEVVAWLKRKKGLNFDFWSATRVTFYCSVWRALAKTTDPKANFDDMVRRGVICRQGCVLLGGGECEPERHKNGEPR